MSTKKSIVPLIKLSHGESIETIELKDKIDLLTHMLTNPQKGKRDTYVAANLYDKKGNFNTEHWGYQLVGASVITSVPIILICGSLTVAMASGMDFNPALLIATGGIIGAETLAIGATGAYMTIRGAKMEKKIREELITNLKTLGYQITPNNEKLKTSMESYQTNNRRLLDGEVISTGNNKYIHLIEEDEFVAKVSNLIIQIQKNPYPGSEIDIEDLKQIAIDWMAINFREYRRTGQKLDISYAPNHLYEAYESEILSKINKTLKKVSR